MIERWQQWTGRVVDGTYSLRQYLGGSECCGVFLTERVPRVNESAAIKLILAEHADADLILSRWADAAELAHANLLSLFHWGRCRLDETDLLYVVMEYAEENLSQVLPRRPLSVTETREMLGPMLSVLPYLHAKGFVHGGIKPANIMANNDLLKLSSDGIRKSGMAIGSSRALSVYDPPEAASGDITQSGDAWSLGVTMVEALTQHLPGWTGAAQQNLVLPGNMPEPFQGVARDCLHRDPQRRMSVAAIASRLEIRIPSGQRPDAVGSPKKAEAPKRVAAPPKRCDLTPYVITAVAVGLALAALFIGPRIFETRVKTSPAISASKNESESRAKHVQKQATVTQKQPARETAKEEQGPTGSVPAASSPHIDTGAKKYTGNVVRGEAINQVLPNVPQKASDTITGKVIVKVGVSVDASGNVLTTTLVWPGPSKYFANLSLQAAQKWTFKAAQADEQDVPSEWVIVFQYEQTGTHAFPSETSP